MRAHQSKELGLTISVVHEYGVFALSHESKQALLAHIAAHHGAVQGEIPVPTSGGDLTLLHVPPTPDRPFHTLVSCGLSAAPMAVPDDQAEVPTFAELMLLLPFQWPVDEAGFQHPATAWPLRVLASIASFPHTQNAWLAAGHSLPNGDPPAPFAKGLDFCGVMLAPPMSLAPEARSFVRADGQRVALYGVLPVFERELELKQQEGASALLKRFDAAGINELLAVDRESVAGALIELLQRNR